MARPMPSIRVDFPGSQGHVLAGRLVESLLEIADERYERQRVELGFTSEQQPITPSASRSYKERSFEQELKVLCRYVSGSLNCVCARAR